MHNAKLIKWFLAWVGLMLVLVVFTLPEKRPPKIETISFDTTESAELYFKNVRSFYYGRTEEAGGILDVYRLESVFADSVTSLPFALYNNWRSNEAFVRLDTAFLDTKTFDRVLADSAGIKTDTVYFPEMTNESQYSFAKEIYQALGANERIGLMKGGEVVWLSETMCSSVKRTLTDYFRLTDRI